MPLRTIKFLLFTCGLLMASASVRGQSRTCPANFDFNYGMSNWTYQTGYSNCGGNCIATNSNAPLFGNVVNSGPIPGRHTISNGTGIDKYGGFPVVAQYNGNPGIKVGGDSADFSASRIRYKVSIPTYDNKYSIQFYYAAVIKDPGGHTDYNRPAITIKVIDSATGLAVPCREILITASDTGFVRNATDTSIKYVPWRLSTLNLSGLAGKDVFIEVTALSCGDGNHWAYCYFDPISCDDYAAVLTTCEVSKGLYVITAPPGGTSYKWYKGPNISGVPLFSQYSSTVQVPRPDTETFYYCIRSSATTAGCLDTLRSPGFTSWKVVPQPQCGMDSSTKYVWFTGELPQGRAFAINWYRFFQLPFFDIHGPDVYGRWEVNPPFYSRILQLVVSDYLGCYTRDTFKIRPKAFALKHMQDTVTCPGRPITLNVLDSPSNLNYKYKWGTQNRYFQELSQNDIKSPVFTPTYFPFDYKVLVFVSADGCELFDSVMVHVVDTNISVANDTVCQHTSVIANLQGDSTLRYNWSPAEGIAPGQHNWLRPAITADTSRTYTITASHPNCPTISKQLSIIAEPNPSFSLGADTIFKCPDIPIKLNAMVTPAYSAYTYVWDSLALLTNIREGTANYNGLGDEQIILTVSTSHDCRSSDTQWVQASTTPLLELTDSASIRHGEQVRLIPQTDATSYRWHPASYLDVASAKSPVATPIVSTEYYLVASNDDGCSAIDSIYVKVETEESIIAVPNAFTPGLSPNNLLKVLYAGSVQLRYFRVYNRWGTLVFESKDIHRFWDGSYQGVQQPAGVYVYVAEAVDEQSRKLVKTGNVTLLR
jgi:gliding motility-associated-like protein